MMLQGRPQQRKRHLQPLGGRRHGEMPLRSGKHTDEAPRRQTPPTTTASASPSAGGGGGYTDLTELERRYHLRQDLASSTSRIDAILASMVSRDTDNFDQDRARLAQLLEGHAFQSRQVSESLSEISSWQRAVAESRMVEIAEKEATTSDIATSTREGYKLMAEIDDSNRKRLNFVRSACERAATAEARLRDSTKKQNNKQRSVGHLSNSSSSSKAAIDDDDPELLAEQGEIAKLREQATKAQEGVAQAELEAQTMAHQMREAQETVAAVRDEYDQEMDKLSRVVANLEQKDRIVHLKWRDGAVLASQDMSTFRSASKSLPEATKMKKEIETLKESLAQERQKAHDASSQLRTSRGLIAELEDDLKRTQDELQRRIGGKDDSKADEHPDEKTQRLLASTSPDLGDLIHAAVRQARRPAPSWEVMKAIVRHLEPAYHARQAAEETTEKRVKQLEAELRKITASERAKSSPSVGTSSSEEAAAAGEALRIATERTESAEQDVKTAEERASAAEERAMDAMTKLVAAQAEATRVGDELAKLHKVHAEERERADRAVKEAQLELRQLREQKTKDAPKQQRKDRRMSKASKPKALPPERSEQSSGPRNVDEAVALEERIDQLQIEEEGLRGEIERKNKILALVKSQCASTDESLKRRKRELASLDEQHEKFQAEIVQLTARRDSVRMELASARRDQLEQQRLLGHVNVEVETEETFDCQVQTKWTLDATAWQTQSERAPQIESKHELPTVLTSAASVSQTKAGVDQQRTHTTSVLQIKAGVDPKQTNSTLSPRINVRVNEPQQIDTASSTPQTEMVPNPVLANEPNEEKSERAPPPPKASLPGAARKHHSWTKPRNTEISPTISQPPELAIEQEAGREAEDVAHLTITPPMVLREVDVDRLIAERLAVHSDVPSTPSTGFACLSRSVVLLRGEIPASRQATPPAMQREISVPELAGEPLLNGNSRPLASDDQVRNYVDVRLRDLIPPGGFQSKNEVCEYIDSRLNALRSKREATYLHEAIPPHQDTPHDDARVHEELANTDVRKLEAHVRKVQEELEATKAEKMTLALKTSEQRQELAELNAFLNKAQKVLTGVKRDTLDGIPRGSQDSSRSLIDEEERIGELTSILNFADNLKAGKNEKQGRNAKLKSVQGTPPSPKAQHTRDLRRKSDVLARVLAKQARSKAPAESEQSPWSLQVAEQPELTASPETSSALDEPEISLEHAAIDPIVDEATSPEALWDDNAVSSIEPRANATMEDSSSEQGEIPDLVGQMNDEVHATGDDDTPIYVRLSRRSKSAFTKRKNVKQVTLRRAATTRERGDDDNPGLKLAGRQLAADPVDDDLNAIAAMRRSHGKSQRATRLPERRAIMRVPDASDVLPKRRPHQSPKASTARTRVPSSGRKGVPQNDDVLIKHQPSTAVSHPDGNPERKFDPVCAAKAKLRATFITMLGRGKRGVAKTDSIPTVGGTQHKTSPPPSVTITERQMCSPPATTIHDRESFSAYYNARAPATNVSIPCDSEAPSSQNPLCDNTQSSTLQHARPEEVPFSHIADNHEALPSQEMREGEVPTSQTSFPKSEASSKAIEEASSHSLPILPIVSDETPTSQSASCHEIRAMIYEFQTEMGNAPPLGLGPVPAAIDTQKGTCEATVVIDAHLTNLWHTVESLEEEFQEEDVIEGHSTVQEVAIDLAREHVVELRDAARANDWGRVAELVGELTRSPERTAADAKDNESVGSAAWHPHAKGILANLLHKVQEESGQPLADADNIDAALEMAASELAGWLNQGQEHQFEIPCGFDKTSIELDKRLSELMEQNRELEQALADVKHEIQSETAAVAKKIVVSAPPQRNETDSSPQVKGLKFTALDSVAMVSSSQKPATVQVLTKQNARDSSVGQEAAACSKLNELERIFQRHKLAINAVLRLRRAAAENLRDSKGGSIDGYDNNSYENCSTRSFQEGNGSESPRSTETADEESFVEVENTSSFVDVDRMDSEHGISVSGDSAASESAREQLLPDVPSHQEFEEELTAALEKVDDDASVAVVAEALGKLVVIERSLRQLGKTLDDAAATPYTRERDKEGYNVVNERFSTVAECREEMIVALKEFQMDVVVQARHEMKTLARQAKVMAGWTSLIGHVSNQHEVYEAGAQALAQEIESRGGWRAFIWLRDGDFNEEIDPTLWPQSEALLIWEQLVHHYVQELAAERKGTLDLRKRISALERDLEKCVISLAKRPVAVDALDEQSERGGEEYINEPPNDVPAESHNSVAHAWQQERVAAAKVHVDLVSTLQLALRSTIATGVTPPPPKIAEPTKIRPKEECAEDASLFADKCFKQAWNDLGQIRAEAEMSLQLLPGDRSTPADEQTTPLPPVVRKEPPANIPKEPQPKRVLPKEPTTAVRSAMQLLRRVERAGAELNSNNEDQEERLRELHEVMIGGLRNDVADVRLLNKFVKLAIDQSEKQRARIELLEREIEILVRAQIAAQKSVQALRIACDSKETAAVVENLRCELEATKDKNARLESAILVLQRTRQETRDGPGQLELLEAMMRRHHQVSAIHAALLPRYDEVEAELYVVLAKLRGNKGTKPDLHRQSIQLTKQKDELELRLYAAFCEVEEVEKLMTHLYERVEAATQYVLSGESYRGMLIWAADKEAHFNQPPSPRLAAAARTVAPPVRSLLQAAGSRPATVGSSVYNTDALKRQEVRKFAPPHSRQTPSYELPKDSAFPSKASLRDRYRDLVLSAEFRVKPRLRPVRTNFLSHRARNSYADA